MLGTLFNTGMIIAGSLIGALLGKGLKKEYHKAMMTAMGLAALFIGIKTAYSAAVKSHYPVLFIVSLAIGALIGQALHIDDHFNNLLNRFAKKESGLQQGLSTGILLYCIGTLSIVGPIEAAMTGDITMLLTNGMLDGVTSMVLASTFGVGMVLAAPVLFCWQGGIYLIATLLQGAISNTMITEVSIVGGILIMTSGLTILNIKKISTLNLLPALVVPVVGVLIMGLF
ncbi:DUF554 domain-containing protein [Lacticaseibacillus sharpeae]|uniref:Transport protein n=1 Tax=Lacticaseibacillus sharpeae JCM 1186 = DSM 20505 TaxID=1291052 RepID=A0A0R1ZL37_9LACO|nr:DUF554 domain-containing protein [Lacticaseibacillus sharpeae]KRM55173.1 transport protein [Lacticaseibacillus sharpeae JCM 1186 = DSM 20505]